MTWTAVLFFLIAFVSWDQTAPLFVSVDVQGDGVADRGYLVEFEDRTTLDDRLELVFREPTSLGKRIVLRAKSTGRSAPSPLAKGEKPMSHAQLSPLQLKRTQLRRLP